MSLPSSNFLHLLISEIGSDKILKVKVTTAWSKVKSRSHHEIAHLHTLTNVATTYQLPTPYCLSDVARTRFSTSSSLRQGQIKITPTSPNQCPYQVPTFYTLRFPRYSPDKILKVKVTTARSNQGVTMTYIP